MRFVLVLAVAGIVGVSGIAAVAQAPAVSPGAAASTPLDLEIQETQSLIARYQANEKSMETAMAATKALIESQQGTLARLEAQRPKPAGKPAATSSAPIVHLPQGYSAMPAAHPEAQTVPVPNFHPMAGPSAVSGGGPAVQPIENPPPRPKH